MFEGLVSSLLSKILGDYIENLNTDNLRIGLFGGKVELNNLVLKETCLQEFFPALKVKKGVLGSLQLTVPWRNLKSRPVIVDMSDLFILTTTDTEFEVSPGDLQKSIEAALIKKQKLLEFYEEGVKEAEQLALEESGKKKKKKKGFVDNIVTLILNNLQITLRNIHIKVDDTSVASHNCAIGITLNSFRIKSCDKDFNEMFIEGKPDEIYKKANLDGFSLYCNHGSSFEFFKNDVFVGVDDFKDFMRSQIPNSDNKNDPMRDHIYILEPVSFDLELTLNREGFAFDGITPQVIANLGLQNLNLKINDRQMSCLMEIADFSSEFVKRFTWKDYRPTVTVMEDRMAWWKFAIEYAKKTSATKIAWTLTDGFFEERRRDRLAYIALINQAKEIGPIKAEDLSEEQEELKSLIESRYSLSDLIFFRKCADVELKGLLRRYEESLESAGMFARKQKKAALAELMQGLSDEERLELYRSVDDFEIDEGAVDTDVPDDYIKIQSKFCMESVSVALAKAATQKAFATVALSDIKGGLTINDFGTIDVDFALGDLSLSNLKQQRLFGLLEVSNDLLTSHVVLNPIPDESKQINPDLKLDLHLEETYIVTDFGFIGDVISFFANDTPSELKELASKAADASVSKYDDYSAKATEAMYEALQNRKMMELNIDLCAPSIIVPRNSLDSLVIKPGRLFLNSVEMENMYDTYERFNLSLQQTSMYIVEGNFSQLSFTEFVQTVCTSTGNSLLKPIELDCAFARNINGEDRENTGMIVDVILKPVLMRLSDADIHFLVDLGVEYIKKLDMLKPETTDMVEANIITIVDAPKKPTKEIVEKVEVVEVETNTDMLDMLSKYVEMSISLKFEALHIDLVRECETFAKISFGGLNCDVKKYPHGMHVNTSFGSLGIVPTGTATPLLYCGDDKGELLSFNMEMYSHHPVTEHIINMRSIETLQSIDVSLGKLSFDVNREFVFDMILFGLDMLDYMKYAGLITEESKDVELEINSDATNDAEIDVVDDLVPIHSNGVYDIVKKTSVKYSFDGLSLSLSKNNGVLASASITGLCGVLEMDMDGLFLKTVIDGIDFIYFDGDDCIPIISSPDQFLSVRLGIPTDGVMNINAELGTLKICFVLKCLLGIADYATESSAINKVFSLYSTDAVSAASQKADEAAENLKEVTTLPNVALSLKAVEVIVPRNSIQQETGLRLKLDSLDVTVATEEAVLTFGGIGCDLYENEDILSLWKGTAMNIVCGMNLDELDFDISVNIAKSCFDLSLHELSILLTVLENFSEKPSIENHQSLSSKIDERLQSFLPASRINSSDGSLSSAHEILQAKEESQKEVVEATGDAKVLHLKFDFNFDGFDVTLEELLKFHAGSFATNGDIKGSDIIVNLTYDDFAIYPLDGEHAILRIGMEGVDDINDIMVGLTLSEAAIDIDLTVLGCYASISPDFVTNALKYVDDLQAILKPADSEKEIAAEEADDKIIQKTKKEVDKVETKPKIITGRVLIQPIIFTLYSTDCTLMLESTVNASFNMNATGSSDGLLGDLGFKVLVSAGIKFCPYTCIDPSKLTSIIDGIICTISSTPDLNSSEMELMKRPNINMILGSTDEPVSKEEQEDDVEEGLSVLRQHVIEDCGQSLITLNFQRVEMRISYQQILAIVALTNLFTETLKTIAKKEMDMVSVEVDVDAEDFEVLLPADELFEPIPNEDGKQEEESFVEQVPRKKKGLTIFLDGEPCSLTLINDQSSHMTVPLLRFMFFFRGASVVINPEEKLLFAVTDSISFNIGYWSPLVSAWESLVEPMSFYCSFLQGSGLNDLAVVFYNTFGINITTRSFDVLSASFISFTNELSKKEVRNTSPLQIVSHLEQDFTVILSDGRNENRLDVSKNSVVDLDCAYRTLVIEGFNCEDLVVDLNRSGATFVRSNHPILRHIEVFTQMSDLQKIVHIRTPSLVTNHTDQTVMFTVCDRTMMAVEPNQTVGLPMETFLTPSSTLKLSSSNKVIPFAVDNHQIAVNGRMHYIEVKARTLYLDIHVHPPLQIVNRMPFELKATVRIEDGVEHDLFSGASKLVHVGFNTSATLIIDSFEWPITFNGKSRVLKFEEKYSSAPSNLLGQGFVMSQVVEKHGNLQCVRAEFYVSHFIQNWCSLPLFIKQSKDEHFIPHFMGQEMLSFNNFPGFMYGSLDKSSNVTLAYSENPEGAKTFDVNLDTFGADQSEEIDGFALGLSTNPGTKEFTGSKILKIVNRFVIQSEVTDLGISLYENEHFDVAETLEIRSPDMDADDLKLKFKLGDDEVGPFKFTSASQHRFELNGRYMFAKSIFKGSQFYVSVKEAKPPVVFYNKTHVDIGFSEVVMRDEKPIQSEVMFIAPHDNRDYCTLNSSISDVVFMLSIAGTCLKFDLKKPLIDSLFEAGDQDFLVYSVFDGQTQHIAIYECPFGYQRKKIVEKEPMKVEVSLVHIGVSFIDETPQELFLLEVVNFKLSLQKFETRMILDLKLGDLQLDDLRCKANEKFVIHKKRELGNQNSQRDLFHLLFIKNTRVPNYIELLEVLLREICVKVTGSLLHSIKDIVALFDVAPVLESLALLTDSKSNEAAQEEKLKDELQQIDTTLVFGKFLVHPIQVNLSLQNFNLDDFMTIPIVNALSGILSSISDFPFTLKSLELNNFIMQSSVFVSLIKSQIFSNLAMNVAKLIGSLDIIGNPLSLLNSVGFGVKSLFYSPFSAEVTSVDTFFKSVFAGGELFVVSVLSGVTNSVTSVVGSIENGFAILSADDEFQEELRVRNAQQVDHIGDGIIQGVSILGTSILDGIVGVVAQPVRGAQNEGFFGAIKGVGKGVVGLAAKPLAGSLSLASKVVVGAKNTFVNSADPYCYRFPRWLVPGKPIVDYLMCCEGAGLQVCLKETNDDFNDDVLMYYCRHEDKVLLMTRRTVLIVRVPPVDHCGTELKVLDSVSYSDVIEIVAARNGVLSFNKQKGGLFSVFSSNALTFQMANEEVAAQVAKNAKQTVGDIQSTKQLSLL
ncbi:hypothetical protein PCE1_003587 [Barthelona sp. PCE]